MPEGPARARLAAAAAKPWSTNYTDVQGGSVTINADRKSGTVDVRMTTGDDIPESTYARGHWRCK